ncbi:hypothetical protein [Enterovirga aerilata]|uniref:Lipoprotein n=1 Tax=Enterovirga aerilata TaxID=2730920 RepID=A0A849I4L9_9HYPH|nr:hypothetical protein [Enterovirga sp. DB1703]NNM72271.1 hypothetical protein [Enterovirga sp. DB1703]
MPILKLAPVLAAAGLLAGCVSSTDYAYPVTGDPVNPTPVPGYRVQCDSVPTVPNLFGDDHVTGCRQIIGPASDVVVAKG